MNTVEPIRGKKLIHEFAEVLKSYSERDYVIFMCGIYLGRRISDILSLKVKDVKDKDFLYIRESKKNKDSTILINRELKKILKEYCKDKKDDEFLFPSVYGDGSVPITRQRYWQILKKAAAEIGYTEKIGCHSLRKTLGRTLYESGIDCTVIMHILGHDDVNYTKRYIGVTSDEINKILSSVKY